MIIETVEEIAAIIQMSLKRSLDTFITLETAENSTTLVGYDGSLVSMIRLDGTRKLSGNVEYEDMVNLVSRELRPIFDRPGAHMQVWFCRDKDRSLALIPKMLKPLRSAAAAKGIDLDDLIEEEGKNLAKHLAWEACYIVFWTSPAALAKAEWKRLAAKAVERVWVKARNAQYPFRAVRELLVKHEGTVDTLMSLFQDNGMQAELIDVHSAVKRARAEVTGEVDPDADNWRACLPGDDTRPRFPTGPDDDPSDVLWPPLPHQISRGCDAKDISGPAEKIGCRLWSGIDVALLPQEEEPFQVLLNKLPRNIPFRISFLIESGGLGGKRFLKMIAAMLAFANSDNGLIAESIKGLLAVKDQPIVKLRVTLATWAPIGEEDLLERRVSALMETVDRWGYCQTERGAGDPLQSTLASALALHRKSTAPAAGGPLEKVVRLLPLQRPSSPWKNGAVLLRSADGKIWPLGLGTSLQNFWFDLYFGEPGSGKSAQANMFNLSYILSNTKAELPYLGVMDIGPSGSGVISVVREGLPAGRKHEAAFFKLRMSIDGAINPYDTPPGCRKPPQSGLVFLRNLMMVICLSAGQDVPPPGLAELITFVIDEMYQMRSDKEDNGAEPHGYLEGIEPLVDAALERHGIKLSREPLWWEVVDKLFAVGAHHERGLAQCYASPLLGDAVVAARKPRVRTLLADKMVGSSSESVLAFFEFAIMAATKQYPVLAGPTKFDIGGARVCILDLADVAPKGGDEERKQSGIMYMLARHAMTKTWMLDDELVNEVDPLYRDYYAKTIPEMRAVPKRLGYDEFHRTEGVTHARTQVMTDGREGRKWNMQVYMSSQLIEDFSDPMVKLATGIYIFGAGGEGVGVEDVAAKFNLGETAKVVLRTRLNGPKSWGAPMLAILRTKNGQYMQYLVSSAGPIKLWALSTTAEDVEIRNGLYKEFGPKRARQILAQVFPEGSAKSEVERRTAYRAAAGISDEMAGCSVAQEILEEMINRQWGGSGRGQGADSASSRMLAESKLLPEQVPAE